MKKIMIAAAAVLMGVVANAASINWTMSNAYVPGSTSDRIASGSGLVYLFCAEEYAASSVQSILSSTEMALADKIAALNSNSIGTSAMTGAGRVSTSTAWDKAAGSYTFYGVVFADTAVKEGGQYILTGITGEVGWDNSSDATVGLGNMRDATQVASNWSTVAAVPEPTSGLLLLLGMAGLALRRRRA